MKQNERFDVKMAEKTWKPSPRNAASPPVKDSRGRKEISLNENGNMSIKRQNKQANKQTVSVTHQVKSLKYLKRKQVEQYRYCCTGEN